MQDIRALLERAYTDFHTSFRRERDPISVVHRYLKDDDQEIAAFFTAMLAYGNAKAIISSSTSLLDALGDSPHQAILDGHFEKAWSRFQYRFTTASDVIILGHWIRSALLSHGSIESFFGSDSSPTTSTADRISSFVTRLNQQPVPKKYLAPLRLRHRYLKHLVSNPQNGSACKRLNLFLRWVVRAKDGIDLGLWTQLEAKDLILPVDVHVLKGLRALNWTQSKSANWKVAEIATQKLRQLSFEDPIRYDFSLCHLSMSGNDLSRYRHESME